MTVIAGLVHEGVVWIGADSAGVDHNGRLTIRRDPKVFQVGPLLIGGTTSFRMLQLLQTKLVVPEYIQARDTDPYRFLVSKVVDAFRACFQEGGFATKHDEQEEGGTFLVGFAGRLFTICDDYQVAEADEECDAVGGGGPLALGSLHSTGLLPSTRLEPLRRIKLALHAAEAHSAFVRAPFVIKRLPEEESASG